MPGIFIDMFSVCSRSVSGRRGNFSLSKCAKCSRIESSFLADRFAFHLLYPLDGVSFHYQRNDRHVRVGMPSSNTFPSMGDLPSRAFPPLHCVARLRSELWLSVTTCRTNDSHSSRVLLHSFVLFFLLRLIPPTPINYNGIFPYMSHFKKR